MPGDEIREARKKAGMTQTELAERLGVSKGTVAMWELNQRCPSVKMLRKICIVLGTTPDSILGFCKSKKGAENGNTGD